MPRFYFDIGEGSRVLFDEEGLQFDQAEHEAVKAAAEIGRDNWPNGDAREITVEVLNEHRQLVLLVTASLKIARPDADGKGGAGKLS